METSVAYIPRWQRGYDDCNSYHKQWSDHYRFCNNVERLEPDTRS